jgi:hypothetical protein
LSGQLNQLEKIMTVLKRKEHPNIDAMLKRALPNYRKHSVILFDHGSVTNHGSQWDGGSRNFTSLFNRDGSGFRSMPGPTAPPQFGGGASTSVKLDDETIALVSGTFRGRPSTVSIYCTPLTAEWFKENKS